MQEVANTIMKVRGELDKSDFGSDERRVLGEILSILSDLDDRTEALDFPTRQLLELLDDFDGTDNPLFMFIAFIYKHLDDYFADGVLGDFFDNED